MKAKVEIVEDDSDTIYPIARNKIFIAGWGLGVHTFLRGINLEVNVIARLELELANFETAVLHICHYTTRTSR